MLRLSDFELYSRWVLLICDIGLSKTLLLPAINYPGKLRIIVSLSQSQEMQNPCKITNSMF